MNISPPDTEQAEQLHNGLQWETPSVFKQDHQESSPYPLDALPSIIQNAVSSYQNYGQQPLPIIACSALANVSLACQTLSNVARDKYLVSPVSLYFIISGLSGERKSASDHTFGEAVRQWQLDTREKLAPEIKVAEIIHRTWSVEKEALLSQIRRDTMLHKNTNNLHELLIEHVSNEPHVPLLPVLFFEDTTQEALAEHIASGWPSASLWSDEGAIIMNGHGMQNNTTKFIALLNRLWESKPFIAHRKTTSNFTVANRRLTISLMMQPIILEQMLAKNGGISRQTGFLARSLIACPKSEMGNRFYKEPPAKLPSMQKYHNRLLDCLDNTLALDKHGCHNLPTLNFSKAAKIEWVAFFNQLESGLSDPKLWKSIRDFASKAAENAARLAALFHLFNGSSASEISAENMDQSISVIRWHLNETKRVLGSQFLTPTQQSANKLLKWILDHEIRETSPRELVQYGPIRDKDKRDEAIETLIEDNCLKEFKAKKKVTLVLNPCFYE
ncbi:MAG: hypothetical protein A3F11_06335 [Gammaproteobacteria bacterium RIFCSPHIGHO2_12_FULL_37_14]|nr:MAG: hypothetical protein A3F11_06335 [Gammaproteobacteria bacterium RIFCSPHIGHO2_12_FULL_37_14]